MASPKERLGAVSYLVLGLIATQGPSTPYELKRFVGRSIGYFWAFPHSQLYAEPERLAAAGLLKEAREEGGRRRRVFSLTRAGRSALRAWLRTPVEESAEIRDLGLLKLFFGGLSDPSAVVSLARDQQAAHRRRLEEYADIESLLSDRPELRYPQLALRMGKSHERASLRFWEAVEREHR